MRSVILCLGVLGLMLGAGCGNFPEVAAVEGDFVEDAPYPTLVPLDTVLIDEPSNVPEDLNETLTGRAEALQARADRLAQRTVVTDESRTRMQDGVAVSQEP